MPIIEYSSMCLNEFNYKDKIIEAKKMLEKEGLEFGVQIHNSIEKSLFDKLVEFKNEIKFSIHSPVFSDYFLNLASQDIETTRDSIVKTCEYLDMFNTDILFFHAFFTTDKPILHDMKNYRKTISNSMSPKLSLNESFIMNPEYFETQEFLMYKERFISNLKIIKKEFSKYLVTLENDFVGIGSALQRPKEIFELTDNLWFDLGHFWCSSLLHKFDFYELSDEIINKKNIPGVHINHNLMSKDDRVEDIKDSHEHLYTKSSQNLKPLIRKIFDKNIKIMTLEILDGDINDIKILLDWLN